MLMHLVVFVFMGFPRVQESLECHSPEGFVPSSSPESVVDMEVSRYPDLSFIKLEQPSPCPSPTLPIIPCTWGKGQLSEATYLSYWVPHLLTSSSICFQAFQ